MPGLVFLLETTPIVHGFLLIYPVNLPHRNIRGTSRMNGVTPLQKKDNRALLRRRDALGGFQDGVAIGGKRLIPRVRCLCGNGGKRGAK